MRKALTVQSRQGFLRGNPLLVRELCSHQGSATALQHQSRVGGFLQWPPEEESWDVLALQGSQTLVDPPLSIVRLNSIAVSPVKALDDSPDAMCSTLQAARGTAIIVTTS